MKKLLFLILVSICNLNSEEFSFTGKHFVASYMDCDLKALIDLDGLTSAMSRAVASSGATILDTSYFVFAPNGLTAVYLLSESHATIHTYPEHKACFVDLFTCGDSCSSENFDLELQKYLKPGSVSAKVFERGEEIQEILR